MCCISRSSLRTLFLPDPNLTLKSNLTLQANPNHTLQPNPNSYDKNLKEEGEVQALLYLDCPHELLTEGVEYGATLLEFELAWVLAKELGHCVTGCIELLQTLLRFSQQRGSTLEDNVRKYIISICHRSVHHHRNDGDREGVRRQGCVQVTLSTAGTLQ